MNVYTVGKATQGLSAYVLSVNPNGKVAIAYDSRIKSDVFARDAATIFATNGIHVYLYKELMPTPMLSYAVRALHCDAGVVVTASHNPAKYNGYKAYGNDGCQLGPEAADYVLSIMNGIDVFSDIKRMDFDTAVAEGKIEYIGDDVINAYLDAVEARRAEPTLDVSDLKVIYTPLNGTGNKPVRAIMKRMGMQNVTVVPEQENPDGNFPTAPFPNPEIRQAFECALKLAKDVQPDLLLATDPDADRIGIAVPDGDDYRLFSGNDTGALLLNYVLERRKANGTLPENPVAVKTIVTTELCQKICDDYGCELRNVLTGFKFIGEQIGLLEEKHEEERYIFGFEESYGYLAGSYVRDKDAVIAAMLICEMTAYYKKQGITLIDQLDNIYRKYGYYYCAQNSFYCEGQSGMQHISDLMEGLRNDPPKAVSGSDVIRMNDYGRSVSVEADGTQTVLTLPKSNVLSFFLADGSSMIVRPSGTEPKIKLYVSAVGTTSDAADKRREELVAAGTEMLGF
ncbi:MAG: phospho-sugar mutase, partial [Clostridia bacterium]|nr:phospho-sugar mutase [Clostridia bacterium]